MIKVSLTLSSDLPSQHSASIHPQHGRLLCYTLIRCAAPAYDGHVKISEDSSRKRQKTACPSVPATQIQNREMESTHSHAPPSFLQPLPGSYTTLAEPELGSTKALEQRSNGRRDWIPYHGGVGSHAARE